MARMPAHPVPTHRMRDERCVEPLPEIDVLDWLLVGGAPAVGLPFLDPGGDPVAQILAVGVKVDEARPLERFERGDGRHQLHTVVGRVLFTAGEFLLGLTEFEDRAPAAWAGIARTG